MCLSVCIQVVGMYAATHKHMSSGLSVCPARLLSSRQSSLGAQPSLFLSLRVTLSPPKRVDSLLIRSHGCSHLILSLSL